MARLTHPIALPVRTLAFGLAAFGLCGCIAVTHPHQAWRLNTDYNTNRGPAFQWEAFDHLPLSPFRTFTAKWMYNTGAEPTNHPVYATSPRGLPFDDPYRNGLAGAGPGVSFVVPPGNAPPGQLPPGGIMMQESPVPSVLPGLNDPMRTIPPIGTPERMPTAVPDAVPPVPPAPEINSRTTRPADEDLLREQDLRMQDLLDFSAPPDLKPRTSVPAETMPLPTPPTPAPPAAPAVEEPPSPSAGRNRPLPKPDAGAPGPTAVLGRDRQLQQTGFEAGGGAQAGMRALHLATGQSGSSPAAGARDSSGTAVKAAPNDLIRRNWLFRDGR